MACGVVSGVVTMLEPMCGDDPCSDDEIPKEDWGFQLERVGVGSFAIPTAVVQRSYPCKPRKARYLKPLVLMF